MENSKGRLMSESGVHRAGWTHAKLRNESEIVLQGSVTRSTDRRNTNFFAKIPLQITSETS
jgi:hypothetical protein